MARTIAERLRSSFWNQRDIQLIFQLPYKVARKTYALADKLDSDELQGYRVYDTKVRASTVEKILGIKKADIA